MSKSSPARQAINQHVHRHHGGAALAGSTQSRFVQHDLMHGKDDDGTDLLSGKPLHYHEFDETGAWEKYIEPIFPEGSE